MAEENNVSKKEAWLNYLALTTVIFAVCATLSTFKGGGFSTRSVMSQSQASDQWAYFQSKGIKSYLYQLQAEKLELELSAMHQPSTQTLSAYADKITAYKKMVGKYEAERIEIEQKAKQLESIRDESQIHSKAFGIAVIYLQIAILLSSIAGLLKKRVIWYGGVVTGLIGLLYFADGFLVFLPA